MNKNIKIDKELIDYIVEEKTDRSFALYMNDEEWEEFKKDIKKYAHFYIDHKRKWKPLLKDNGEPY